VNYRRGKARIAAVAICAIVAGLLYVTILGAPFASPRASGARMVQLPPPSRPISSPPGATLESQPEPLAPYAPDYLSADGAPAATSGVWTPLNNQPSFFAVSIPLT